MPSALFRTSLQRSRGPAGKRPLHPIAQAWLNRFGDALPAGHLCRQSSLADRWLRIHSLPESKRYPDDDAQLAEVLRRQNAVASELLGEGALCLLFFACWSGGPEAARLARKQTWLQTVGGMPELVLTAEESDDGDQMAFLAQPVTWHPGAFDRLIADRANDRTWPLLFANLHRGSIYAPYDGGADLFYPSSEDVDPARSRHRDWLPTRASGM
ncbi:hypothetical protein PV762_23610 [Mitsuaria sp. CC2]|uniref:DUF3885 domain-containing protein n=1 Tax=Mitsuaria sp. CC2 TaxID=3029186 RepID=UPI003B8D6D08